MSTSPDFPLESALNAALPGLADSAAPARMLQTCRDVLTQAPAEQRGAWTNCSVMEAVYQPGRACRISYSLTGPDDAASELVYARWSSEPEDEPAAFRVPTPRGAFLLFRYPRDRRMSVIRSMRRKTWLHRASNAWFARLLGHGAMDTEGWRCGPLKWVPESRLFCLVTGHWRVPLHDRIVHAFVRIHRRDVSRAQFSLLNRLNKQLAAQRADLAVPRPLGAMALQHLLAVEYVPGPTLMEVLAERGEDRLARTVRALTRIARLDPGPQWQVVEREAVALPQRMLADLAGASAELHDRCAALAGWAAAGPPPARVRGLVNGDLHAGQIRFMEDHAYVVDWDRAHVGDPTEDLMNLASDFDASATLAAGAPIVPAEALAAACVAAWRSAGGVFDADTARWRAARGLVYRAWSKFRRLLPGWPTAAPRLLERAAEVYSRGCAWTQ